jgi:hypothetical protein
MDVPQLSRKRRDQVKREVLYNTVKEFGITMMLVTGISSVAIRPTVQSRQVKFV